MTNYTLRKSHRDLSRSEWLSVVEFYKQGYTARQTADKFGLEFKPALVSALARECPKAEHGGARRGAGNLSPEMQAAKAVANAMREAKAIGVFSTLDPDSVNGENYNEKRVETRNKINKAIAALKALAATLGAAAIIYLFLC